MEQGLVQKTWATVALAVAFALETLDDAAFTAMYLALSAGLDISLSAVGALSMWRGISQALTTPFVSIAGNAFNRMHLIAGGTALSSAMYIGLGLAKNGTQAAILCAGNGIGLAVILPTIQSVVSELYIAKHRGRAFGCMLTTAAIGGVGCSIAAVTYSMSEIGLLQGWQAVFFGLAVVFAGVSLLVPLIGIEPRSQLAQGRHFKAEWQELSFWKRAEGQLREMWSCLGAVFRVRTFLAILAVNSVWVVCNGGIGFMVVYFQLLGFSNAAAAMLVVCWRLGIAAGNFLGGALGDAAAARLPGFGRLLVPQLGMLAATPLCVILLKAMPGDAALATGTPGSQDHLLPQYGALLFAINAVSVWHCPNNSSLYAEVVPTELRTSVYAFDKAINVALYAVSGPLAALLAQSAFGFIDPPRAPADAATTTAATGTAAAVANFVADAAALENMLLSLLVVPRLAVFLIFFAVHFTLPGDRMAVEEGQPLGEEKEKNSMEDVERGYLEAARRLVQDGAADSAPFTVTVSCNDLTSQNLIEALSRPGLPPKLSSKYITRRASKPSEVLVMALSS